MLDAFNGGRSGLVPSHVVDGTYGPAQQGHGLAIIIGQVLDTTTFTSVAQMRALFSAVCSERPGFPSGLHVMARWSPRLLTMARILLYAMPNRIPRGFSLARVERFKKRDPAEAKSNGT